ncbi:AMP-binding protein [Streptomyces spongiae]|uniref:AMP-binding protein n=1 Tax=Streptomyces spongiae TaxID=565072 RepID=UPI00128B0CC6|nr:AMP-binding protein [Streptomyces spongiae]
MAVLERASRSRSTDPLLVLADRTYSCADVLAHSSRVASLLVSVGVQRGDRVVIILPTVPESVWAWLGTNICGGIDAPLSPDVSGVMLDYYLQDLEPRAVVGTREALERVARSAFVPDFAVVVGAWDGSPWAGPRVQHVHIDDDNAGTSPHQRPEEGSPSDDEVATILYTSGTTGPSKGVMLSRGYYTEMAVSHLRAVPLARGAKAYCAQPLHHVDARSMVVDCLVAQATLVLAERFSASGFWADVERHDVDVFYFIGTMLHLIHLQPDRESEQTMRRRIGIGSAVPAAIHASFQKRFNVALVEGYGMTEAPFMTSQTLECSSPGNVGHPLDSIEARLVDHQDQDVRGHQVGELVIRPKRPHVMMLGYWRKPEATEASMRDGWFHTGDLMRRREDGSLVYVGRRKDSIRRRGENVSAWEVEQIALRHPSVCEAAAFGVPSPLGEEDVAMLLVPAEDQVIDVEQLHRHLGEHLPRFAVPRFLEVVDSLPKTPSERVAKGAVRERGLTSRAFDAQIRRG